MNLFKKMIEKSVLLGLTTLIFLSPFQAANAQGEQPGTLAQLIAIVKTIKSDTAAILLKLQETPTWIEEIRNMAIEWIKNSKLDSEYNNTMIAENQAAFVGLLTAYIKARGAQIDLSNGLISQVLMQGSRDFTNPALPNNANVLSPMILLTGKNIVAFRQATSSTPKETAEEDIAKYIGNISGAGLIIKQPKLGIWLSTPPKDNNAGEIKKYLAYRAYQSYYDTLTSIASYNTYTMGTLLHENPDEQAVETALAIQASSPTKPNGFFFRISTEPLALVLRQILMYESQIYVLLTHILDINRQQLTAQSMIISLGILQTSNSIGAILEQQADQSVGISPVPAGTSGLPHM